MPYPSRVYRSNVIASTGAETVINTIWMRADTILDAGVDHSKDIANTIVTEWSAMILGGTGLPAGLAADFMAHTTWRSVVTYKVNEAGKAVSQAEASFAATVKGSSANNMPPQVAVVGTLLTGAPGRSNRGRIYLGGVAAASVTDQGRINAAPQGRYGDGLAGLYKRLRDKTLQGDVFRPVVVSPTLGAARKITQVQVGDVYDTQRRRRNKLIETRIVRGVDPA